MPPSSCPSSLCSMPLMLNYRETNGKAYSCLIIKTHEVRQPEAHNSYVKALRARRALTFPASESLGLWKSSLKWCNGCVNSPPTLTHLAVWKKQGAQIQLLKVYICNLSLLMAFLDFVNLLKIKIDSGGGDIFSWSAFCSGRYKDKRLRSK